MSDAKHTPGKWQLRTEGRFLEIWDESGEINLADIWSKRECGPREPGVDEEVAYANALAMVNAPELLAMLERFTVAWGTKNEPTQEDYYEADALIAEARGES